MTANGKKQLYNDAESDFEVQSTQGPPTSSYTPQAHGFALLSENIIREGSNILLDM